MKLLQNYWILAVLALIINLLSIGGLVILKMDSIIVLPEPEEPVVEDGSGQTYWSFTTQEIEKLVGELGDRKGSLDSRESTVLSLEKRIAAEMEELYRLRDEVQLYRKELDAAILRVRENEEKNLKTLAKTYSEVKPEAAVGIFREMDDAQVAKILALMKPDAVGEIFEEMATQPDQSSKMTQRAAHISELLRLYEENAKKE